MDPFGAIRVRFEADGSFFSGEVDHTASFSKAGSLPYRQHWTAINRGQDSLDVRPFGGPHKDQVTPAQVVTFPQSFDDQWTALGSLQGEGSVEDGSERVFADNSYDDGT